MACCQGFLREASFQNGFVKRLRRAPSQSDFENAIVKRPCAAALRAASQDAFLNKWRALSQRRVFLKRPDALMYFKQRLREAPLRAPIHCVLERLLRLPGAPFWSAVLERLSVAQFWSAFANAFLESRGFLERLKHLLGGLTQMIS